MAIFLMLLLLQTGDHLIWEETDELNGVRLVRLLSRDTEVSSSVLESEGLPLTEGIPSAGYTATQLWMDSAEFAIMGKVYISDGSNKAFVLRDLNDMGAAIYDMCGSGTPMWTWVADQGLYGVNIASSNVDVYSLIELGLSGEMCVWEQSEDSIPDFRAEGSDVIATSSDGSRIVWLKTDYSLNCIDTETTNLVWSTDFPLVHVGQFPQAQICGDGSRILINSPMTMVQELAVLDMIDGSLVGEKFIYGECISTAGISGDGFRVAQGDIGGEVNFWEFDGTKWEVVKSIQTGEEIVTAVAISQDGNTVIAGAGRFQEPYISKLFCFDWPDSSQPSTLWQYSEYADMVISVDLSADGEVIVAASYGGWNTVEGDVFTALDRSGGVITKLLDDVDTTGSMLWVDVTSDGEWVCCSGRPIHARNWGNGGYVYAYQIVPLEGVESSGSIETLTVGNPYPNPAFSSIHIPYSAPSGGCNITADIFDLSGRLAAEIFQGEVSEGEHTLFCDISSAGGVPIPSGVYLLHIESEETASSRVVLILK